MDLPPDQSSEVSSFPLSIPPELLQQRSAPFIAAKQAFSAGDLEEATRQNRAFWNVDSSFVFENVLSQADIPEKAVATQVRLPNLPPGKKVHFKDALAFTGRGVGLPICADGTVFSRPFAYWDYPRNYLPLYQPQATAHLEQLATSPAEIDNAFVVPARPVYFHFVTDLLPQLFGMNVPKDRSAPTLLLEFGIPQDGWQMNVLKYALPRLGVRDFTYTVPKTPVIKVQNLSTMMPIGFSERAAILKSLIGDVSDLPDTPYIYSQRAPTDQRALKNETDVLAALGPRFKVVRPDQLDFATQIGLFSKAKCVVGVHGSNLTNIIFCPERTAIVEIFSGTPQKMYQAIAEAGAMPYRRVAGLPERAAGDTREDFHLDFSVDPNLVRNATDQVLSVA